MVLKKSVVGSVEFEAGQLTVQYSIPLGIADRGTSVSPAEEPAKEPAQGRATHAPGFESVWWFGIQYSFTKKQRLVVGALWQAWKEEYGAMDQAALMEIADSDQRRLRDLFDQGRRKGHGGIREMAR